MSCWGNEMTQKEHDKIHVAQCPECEGDVDEDGVTCELNDCCYSPLVCETCGYRPCDGSC